MTKERPISSANMKPLFLIALLGVGVALWLSFEAALVAILSVGVPLTVFVLQVEKSIELFSWAHFCGVHERVEDVRNRIEDHDRHLEARLDRLRDDLVGLRDDFKHLLVELAEFAESVKKDAGGTAETEPEA